MAGAREIQVEIQVGRGDAGERVDRLLARELGLTRGYVRRLLRRGKVTLDERPAAKGAQLRAGDRLRVAPFRHPDEGPIAAPELELRVLRSSGGLVAVDKPAGMPTHPLDYEEDDTALNAILARHPEMLGVGEGGLMSGVVHRLDTGTSGVLVFALDDAAWRRAREALTGRRAHKLYLARVHGALRGELRSELRLEQRGPRVRVVERGGRESLTELRGLRVDADTSLVEARPVTGVTHQIRVALAHLGHPVVGDVLYGSPAVLGRHLLHAVHIRLDGFEAASPAPDSIIGAPPGP